MDDRERRRLLAENAESYARVALANIQREYPVAETYFITGPGPLPMPRERHPAFFGSLDWHSCVLMHWVLVRLLRLHPDLAVAAEVRAVLDDHFAADKLAKEAAFFRERPSFERPYGWGWTLRLAHELAASDATSRWRESFAPLTTVIVDGFLTWLPKATYAQRMGLHGNSAWALLLALDHATPRASRRCCARSIRRRCAGTRRTPATSRTSSHPARTFSRPGSPKRHSCRGCWTGVRSRPGSISSCARCRTRSSSRRS